MDRPLKAVPDNLFHNIHRQYDKVVCSQFIQITHSAYSITTANASVLKTGLSEDAHFFQNNKRHWCMKTETGKHQEYISNGFTLSLQKELSTFRNELFNASRTYIIWTSMPCFTTVEKWGQTIRFD